MMKTPASWRGLMLAALVLLVAVGVAPVPGEVVWMPDGWRDTATWPRIRFQPEVPQPGQRVEVVISDVVPWTNVLLAAEEAPVSYVRYEQNASAGYWSWYWSFTYPGGGLRLAFYHNCDTGCVEWAAATAGGLATPGRAAALTPTKLGIVFASPERDWHNRSGWDVELTYAMKAGKDYWDINDLARRVQAAARRGLRVLVRVDYDQQQSLPPAEDFLALDVYLDYARRLARDARLKSVYAFIIGNGYNALDENTRSPGRPTTPEWYARVFNGYGADPAHADNVVETIRAENPAVRVLAGPVRPWVDDQDGRRRYRIDAPWLNYMNTMLAALDESAAANESLGIPLTSPDGFAIQAPGWPEAPELDSLDAAGEPMLDLRRPDWPGARAGFGVYGDWLDAVNSYSRFRGLPAYITSTNTRSPGSSAPPAQNYPRGWLTNALSVVNAEPQVQALCWFLDDFPMDRQWELYSLTGPQGLLVNAADEFDRLLSDRP